MKQVAFIFLTVLFYLSSPVAWGETITDRDLTNLNGGPRTLKKGEKDGLWFSYHDNGQIWTKGTYKNDKREGPWVFYQTNGLLLSKGTY